MLTNNCGPLSLSPSTALGGAYRGPRPGIALAEARAGWFQGTPFPPGVGIKLFPMMGLPSGPPITLGYGARVGAEA